MTSWSLPKLLARLHDDIERDLEIARDALAHPGTKGDASEIGWRRLLQTYLPQRYQAETAHVVDSRGAFSQQIDVVVFDRQYSPFIFQFSGQTIVPAESVYAAFEAKQSINADQVQYAQEKVASVRRLHRTSLSIPHAGGTYEPKPLIPILGGLLALDSDWNPPFGPAFERALSGGEIDGRLDLGCVAACGYFKFDSETRSYCFMPGGKPATAFLFNLISRLQRSGTVQMIDVGAYAEWLSK